MSRPSHRSRLVLAASATALTLVLTGCTERELAAALEASLRPPATGPARPGLPGDTPTTAPTTPPTDEPDPGGSPQPTPDPEPTPDPDPTPDPTDDPDPTDGSEPPDDTDPTDDPEPSDPAEPTDPSEPTDPAEPTDPVEPPDEPGGDGGGMPAITVEGNQIQRGGQPWWFLGYNSFVWSGDCGNDDEKMTEADVEDWFASMRHDGHGAVRLFFYDGWDLDRLDAALASARRHNIYLTLTLDDAIGGCGENDKTAAWFADPSERDTFQNHMETLLQRYRGETTIAWFEYFNEPDYEDGALRTFYDQMGTAADRIDPDRLFSSGTVAPYWVDGEDNFADIHESPGVDIASLHEYDQNEIESNHGDDVRANSAGKPVIVGEFGITACDQGDFTSRAQRFARKAEVYTDTSIGYVGAFGWAWQPGRTGCELGNLDADEATQEVLREFGGAEGPVTAAAVRPTADPAADDDPDAVDEAGAADDAVAPAVEQAADAAATTAGTAVDTAAGVADAAGDPVTGSDVRDAAETVVRRLVEGRPDPVPLS